MTQENLWTESLLSPGCHLTQKYENDECIVGVGGAVTIPAAGLYHEDSLIKVSSSFHICEPRWVMLSWVKICRGMN